MKLLGNKITKDETGESVHYLETTEVILVYRDIFYDDYQ